MLFGAGSAVKVVVRLSALIVAADVGVKVPSTAASPVKRTRAITSREQALRQLIAVAERPVDQAERSAPRNSDRALTTQADNVRIGPRDRRVDLLAAVSDAPFSLPS